MVEAAAPAAERMQVVVFHLHQQRHAVPLAAVERALAAAEVTPLPGAPAAVLGTIDVGGRILPVYSLRRRLGLPELLLDPAQHFLIVGTGRIALVLVVDEVQGMLECDARGRHTGGPAPELEALGRVARGDDGLLLIHDLERLLSPAEERTLAAAMSRSA